MSSREPDSLDHFAELLAQVRAGSVDAIAELYHCYFRRSVALAHSRLHDGEGRVIDEEVAAISALDSLVVRMRGGAYADVQDHLQVWRLLARIVDRKVTKYRRQMYGPTRSPPQPMLAVEQIEGDGSDFAIPVATKDPTPISNLIADEALQRLLDALADPAARSVVLLRLDGFNDIEIADRLGHSRRWVSRRMDMIKGIAESLLRDDN
ncbi:ECF-type sigma factor [Candidatus Laterigemmans baculatus]|uniref:ECF-type sigma factor n=1 Tax=Candidatus Laterigemmans baculatus TaxID=2770505 RepID=UPI0013DA3C71|nr:ECF-type sigma factor [Candidatus Laterigemmans baculatus]